MTIENEELRKCSECGGTWPVSELDNGVCPDCGLVRDGILPPVSERHKIWEITETQEVKVIEDIPVILRAFAAEDDEDD